jgi:hypothetical protein
MKLNTMFVAAVIGGFALNAGFLALNIAFFDANRSDHQEMMAYAAKQNQAVASNFSQLAAYRQNLNLRTGTCFSDADLPKGYTCLQGRPAFKGKGSEAIFRLP